MKVAEVIETSIELLVMGFGLSVGEMCAFVAFEAKFRKGISNHQEFRVVQLTYSRKLDRTKRRTPSLTVVEKKSEGQRA